MEESATAAVWEAPRPGLGPVLLNPTAKPFLGGPKLLLLLLLCSFHVFGLARLR